MKRSLQEQQYTGLKHGDDEDNAFWLAEMLRLKILPEGYIYQKVQRPLRDLLRKRERLVRLRTLLIQSLLNILTRDIGKKMHPNHMKALRTDHVTKSLNMWYSNGGRPYGFRLKGSNLCFAGK